MSQDLSACKCPNTKYPQVEMSKLPKSYSNLENMTLCKLGHRERDDKS